MYVYIYICICTCIYIYIYIYIYIHIYTYIAFKRTPQRRRCAGRRFTSRENGASALIHSPSLPAAL